MWYGIITLWCVYERGDLYLYHVEMSNDINWQYAPVYSTMYMCMYMYVHAHGECAGYKSSLASQQNWWLESHSSPSHQLESITVH